MKKTIAITLAALMLLGAFAGCAPDSDADGTPAGQESQIPESQAPESEAPESESPESAEPAGDSSQLFADAITAARTDEDNEYNEILTDPEADTAQMVFDMLGLTAADMDSFAISISLMNVKAYGVAVIMPAEGSENTVKNGLQNFIDNQKSSFEHYLVDQYEVAASAILETLDDGTVILVMCEDAQGVYDGIVENLTAE